MVKEAKIHNDASVDISEVGFSLQNLEPMKLFDILVSAVNKNLCLRMGACW